jgi:hypothetical protein
MDQYSAALDVRDAREKAQKPVIDLCKGNTITDATSRPRNDGCDTDQTRDLPIASLPSEPQQRKWLFQTHHQRLAKATSRLNAHP